MRMCLRELISEGQRRFAEVPLFIKRDFTDPAAWEATRRASWQVLSDLHRTTVPDRMVFEEAHKATGDIAALEQRWRRPQAGLGTADKEALARLRIWFYRAFLSHHLAGRLGRLVKRLLGRARARQWRLWMEHWVFSGRSGG
jgi:cobalamin biosynthesis protein CobT